LGGNEPGGAGVGNETFSEIYVRTPPKGISRGSYQSR
jgi:hypothetical protein